MTSKDPFQPKSFHDSMTFLQLTGSYLLSMCSWTKPAVASNHCWKTFVPRAT